MTINKNSSSIRERRKKRVEFALENAELAEMRFDSRIHDIKLKNSINETFHSIDTDLKVVKFIKKDDKKDFLDNPYFNQMTERQYRAVTMYIDALIELTFAESCLMFNTDDLSSISYNYIDENNHLINELEHIGNLYEKGLLTDEEFSTMKKKLIERLKMARGGYYHDAETNNGH